MMHNLPETPECDKLLAAKLECDAVTDFLEWLSDERGGKWLLVLKSENAIETVCEAMEDADLSGDEFEEIYPSEQLYAQWKGIDLDKVSRERNALLEAVRA